ncbi:MAG: PD-(D/E)XK nuclease family protein, partial [Actinomycetota bacterium]
QVAALLDAGWRALARAGGDAGRADRRDMRALLALGGLAEDLADAAAAEPATRPRGPLPRGEIGRLLADLTFPDDDGPADGLLVTDPAGLRGRRLRVVAVAGLDSAGIPGRPAPDAFLGPVRAALGDRLPARAEGTDEARLRFVQAVAAAGERLVLVRRFVDDDGRELAPSPYWAEAVRITGIAADAVRRVGGRGEIAEDPAQATTRREALRAVAAAGGTVPGELAAALARRRRPMGFPDGSPFAMRREFRVTELEAYLRCRYAWLHERVLRPAELAPPFDVRAEGTFAHRVLERLYRRMRDEGAGACRDDAALARYLGAVEEEVAATAAELPPSRPGRAHDAFLRRIERHVRDLLARERALEPVMEPWDFEVEVSRDDIVPGATLVGRTDRIDRRDGAVVAIDYKRSGASMDDANVLTRLQLPLYAEAVARGIGGDSAGGLYVPITKSRLAGRVRADMPWTPTPPAGVEVPEDEWRRLVDEAVAAAAAAVEGVRQGRLGAPPAGGCYDNCGHGVLWR